MRVGIVAQRGNSRAAYLASDIAAEVAAEVYFDAETAAHLDRTEEGRPTGAFADSDLVVSIGGDGTFLYAARNAGTTPILGVNLGEVGFLNAIAPEDAVESVQREVERYHETGAVRCREMPRIRASGDDWTVSPALNEIAVLGPQRGRGSGCDASVYVDGDLYTASHADGILVATAVGSSAYNLSEGGPLVRPGTGALVVTGMCAADPMPPLVTDVEDDVTVHVEDADAAVVTSDGTNAEWLTPPTQVTVESAAPARIAGPGVDFFTALGKLE
ncbi:MAG: NAD(+)/NADH kinase [Halobacteriaceae archaeon]